MGVAAILGLAVGAVSTFTQIKQARRAERARREGQAISAAAQQAKDRVERRKLARETRLRRARLLQSSENTGVIASSGQIGASFALASSFNTSIANQNAQALAAKGIGAANAAEANAISKAKTAGAFGDLIQSGIGLADEEGLFD